jgi:hypothetical protein
MIRNIPRRIRRLINKMINQNKNSRQEMIRSYNTYTDDYIVHRLQLSSETNLSVIFFKVSKFCSASIIKLLYSYLILNDFSTVRNKLDFLPSSVISILATTCSFSSRTPDLSISSSMWYFSISNNITN